MSYRSDVMLVCEPAVYRMVKDALENRGPELQPKEVSYPMAYGYGEEMTTDPVHVLSWEGIVWENLGIEKILYDLEPDNGLYRLLVSGESDDGQYIMTNDDGFYEDYDIGFIYSIIHEGEKMLFGDSRITADINLMEILAGQILSSAKSYSVLSEKEEELLDECANFVRAVKNLR